MALTRADFKWRLIRVAAFALFLPAICAAPKLGASESGYHSASSLSEANYGGRQLFSAPGELSSHLASRTVYLNPENQDQLSPYWNESAEAVEIGTLPFGGERRSSLPPGAREGIFQGANFRGTWLPKPNASDFGVSELQLESKFGLPLPMPGANLLISPSFAVNFFDGPIVPDLPSEVYDVRLGFTILRPLNDRWSMVLNVTPTVASDFKADQSDAFRIVGSAVAIHQWNETTKIILGVVYLDRQDVSVLPAAGLIWTPNEDWRFELVAPRPRIAWRLGQCTAMSCVEHWAYFMFEFGGGEWAIVRDSGAQDLVTMRDYRFIYGVERKAVGGVTAHFEVGYVFGRVLEYASATPDFDADDTVMLRVGASY